MTSRLVPLSALHELSHRGFIFFSNVKIILTHYSLGFSWFLSNVPVNEISNVRQASPSGRWLAGIAGRIPPGAWMSVVSVVCCQVEVSATR
jgi:hypothetical protein